MTAKKGHLKKVILCVQIYFVSSLYRLLTLINVLSFWKSLQNFISSAKRILFSVNNIFFAQFRVLKKLIEKNRLKKKSINKPQMKKFWLNRFGMKDGWQGGTHRNVRVHIFLESDLDRSNWLYLRSYIYLFKSICSKRVLISHYGHGRTHTSIKFSIYLTKITRWWWWEFSFCINEFSEKILSGIYRLSLFR